MMRRLTLVILAAAMCGCQQPIRLAPAKQASPEPDPLATSHGADLERGTEVDLVEQMAHNRRQYRNQLDELVRFYDRQGNQVKATWATEELANIDQGPQRAYLVVAELAGADLRGDESILEADLLYEEGLNLMKEGIGKLGKFMVDRRKLRLATDKFNELISNYPTSDKIDDAAFQVGEIHNHYLEDYTTALLYYQRVWQWDEQSMLPARFWMGRIYDERLHNRVEAIKYYEQTINLESSYPAHVVHAQNRIRKLNAEMSGQ